MEMSCVCEIYMVKKEYKKKISVYNIWII